MPTVMSRELSDAFEQKVEALFKDGSRNREIEGLGFDFKGKTVLDLAAGTGHWERIFLSLGAAKVIWQDLSAVFCEMAKKRLQSYPNVDFLLADMLTIPLPDESVDFVMCRDSLFHSPSEERTIAEICRVLKPGGSFYLTARNWRRIFKDTFTWKSPVKLISPYLYRLTGRKFLPTHFALKQRTYTSLQRHGFRLRDIEWDSSTFACLGVKERA